MSATLDFDTGPLNWVRGDIEAALKGAAERIRAFGTDPSLENALRLARDEIHGATGALRMVGLEGAAKVSTAMEDVLTAMDGKSLAADEINTKAVLDALEAMHKWVVRMAEGRGEGELALFPVYRRLRELAGVENVFEGELFYPNLRVQVATETAGASLSADELAQRVKAARAQFQRGLLAFLRGNKAEAGLAAMAKSLAEVEASVSTQAARAFWWACKGFVDALLNKGVEPDVHVKQLLARIDLQMRKLIEGSPQVAEHLMREALFFIARSKSVGDESAAVRSAFGLDKYLPKRQLDAEQMARARPVLKLLKETLGEARNHWHGYSEGKQDALAPFRAAVERIPTQGGALGVAALGELIAAIEDTLAVMGRLTGDALAGAQLEIATTLLFLQNAVDSEDILDPDFQSRAHNQLRRLAAAREGHAEGSAADLMDEGSLKAAEHALLAQLGQEIKSSLQQMEEALDAFFRDPEARDGLASLDMQAAQVQGALAILEQTEASRLLASAMEAIRPYVIAGAPSDEEKARIADALSSLDLFIEAHCAGREDARRILDHPLVAFGLAEPQATPKEEDVDFFVSEAASPAASEAELDPIELAIAEAVNGEAGGAAPAFESEAIEFEPLEAPAAKPPAAALSVAEDEIDESLRGLESYAEWQARTAQEAAAAEAETPAEEAETPAVPEIPVPAETAAQEEAAAAPQTAEAAPAPAAAPAVAAPEIDPELLDIFLEEAVEVLANMAAAADACEANADDRDNLTVVRRAFHTLKGSGRMVGLTDFGETAWGMEQLMNGWLAAEKPATAPLLAVVRRAHDLFEAWVAALRENPAASMDASDVLAEASRVARGQEEAAPAEPAVATAAAEAAPPPGAVAETAGEPEAVIAETPPTEPSPEAAAEAAAEEAAPATEAVPEEIQIGTVRLSAALYDIFKSESANWAKVLDEEIERLSANRQAVISDIARRGVHTLAGIAGTTGFVQLANLALAVETYFRKLETRPVPAAALNTLLDALARINGMIENIHSRVVPMQAAPLIYALNQLPVEPPEAVPQETVVPVAQGAEPIEEGVTGADAEAASAEATETIEVPPVAKTPGEIDAAPAEIAADAETASLPAAVEDSANAEPAPAAEAIELEELVAQPRVQAAPVFEERTIQDEIDPVLLPIFLEEAETLVPEAATALRGWIAAPHDGEAPAALRRALHTIKGSARMAGAMRLGELTHIMESQVIAVLEGQASVDAAMLEKLEAQFDHLATAVDQLKYGTTEPVEARHVETEAMAADVLVPAEHSAAPAAMQASEAQAEAAPPAEPAAAPNEARPQAPAQTVAAAPAEPQHRESATLRVRADWIDRMVNEAGEVAIARSRIESQIYALKRQTSELADALRRLRDHLREVEIQAEAQMQATLQSQADKEGFDPLEFDRFTRFQEVTRFLAESVHDIFTVQQTLTSQLGEADAALLQQARMNRELQQNLMRVRMVPLYSVSERLYRVVRQTARELDKRAQLDIQGGDIEIDRGVLEKIVAPIEHLLRNSIAHGLESPEGRAQAGKPEYGEIRLAARHEGNEMVLTVSDDGRGLDLARIREKAVERGLLDPGVEPGAAQLAQLIFVPGFSTAESVTQVAGRGVGMDVVKNEIASLGGRIEIATEAGKGVRFTIYLPLTLAVTQAVILTANKNEYALPATLVEQVQELKPEQLSAALAARAIEWRGNTYPLFYLPHLLGQSDAVHEVQRFNSIVLMKSGTAHAAVLVDTIEGTREVVVKNIGPQVARITGIAGATVRGDGKVVLILNPVPLAMRALEMPQETVAVAGPQAAVAEEAQAPLVMVVDDSLTVRKITSRLLTREGYRVETAKDGVDALEKMHDILPDVVLLDVEMPRMDGFELARVMRNDTRLKDVPIIMITSRTADKHRNHAMEIGVNVYLGKPYQEAVLLSHIAELLGERALISV